MNKLNNHTIVDSLLKGDQEVMQLLYESLFPRVLSYVRNNQGSKEDAEEIFHDALYQIMIRASTKGVQINSTFDGYVYTVCRNLWLAEIKSRQRKVRNEGVFELKDKDDEIVAAIINQERWELMEEQFLNLSDTCRELMKDYFKKVPYKEIVKKFSYSSENVAFQKVFKCKKRLMDLVKSHPNYKNLTGL